MTQEQINAMVIECEAVYKQLGEWSVTREQIYKDFEEAMTELTGYKKLEDITFQEARVIMKYWILW